MVMAWLNSSIGGHIKEGSLPSVPEELRLEQCVYAPMPHPRGAVLAKKFLHGSPWAVRDMERIPVINDMTSLAVYFWPNSADDTRALTLIKYMQWIFLVDNAVDDLDTPRADRICHRICHHIFASGASPSPPALPDGHLQIENEPLIISLGLEWWKEIQASRFPEQQARFAAVFIKYLRYQAALTRKRAKLQQERSVPGLEEYAQLRQFSSGFCTCLALIEYDVGIELDEETYNSPILQQLLVAAHDHIVCINDILSFPKEFANGEVLYNLLPVLHLRNNEGAEVPFPVAVSQAWQMVKERDEDVARLAQQLRQSLSMKMTPHLERYVETICAMPPGNWAWMLQSPRYKLAPSTTTTTTTTTKAYSSSTFSKCRSPPLPPLAFSPFKRPPKGMKIKLPCAPKRWRDPPLSFPPKGSFSFPPTSPFLC